jgi:glycosyltransferase involved in cell wall biosynthesis
MMAETAGNMMISIVVPLYNEEENIDELYSRVIPVLKGITDSYEIICVNDGSNDSSFERLLALNRTDDRLKIVNLSRNFGKEMALTAGLDLSSGEIVIPIDADLQDPPELIKDLVEKWREGYDIVNACRRSRQGESWLKRTTASRFYRFMNRLSDIKIAENTGDFRLLNRQAIDALKVMPERTRFMKGLFSWVGFRQATIFYDRHPRYAGKTKWHYWKLLNFAFDGFASFSTLPLRVWSYCGVFLSFVSICYALFLIIRTIIYGRDWPGYASTMVAILFIGGIQLISLGVIGEYLGRVYCEVKQRPLYVIRNTVGF